MPEMPLDHQINGLGIMLLSVACGLFTISETRLIADCLELRSHVYIQVLIVDIDHSFFLNTGCGFIWEITT
jgi:hypothetical protein